MTAALQPGTYEIKWQKLPDDYVLDDSPVDNINQPLLAAALSESLELAGRLSETALATINYRHLRHGQQSGGNQGSRLGICAQNSRPQSRSQPQLHAPVSGRDAANCDGIPLRS